MKPAHGLLLTIGFAVGTGFSYWMLAGSVTPNRSISDGPDAEETISLVEHRSELQAARARANRVEVIETKIFESVNVGRSPEELIENLKTVEANSPEFIQRRSVHYLESLVDLGPKSVGPIGTFLAERVDREYLTTRQSLTLNGRPVSAAEQVRRAISNPLPKPNLNFVSPPSLRLGCFTVLLQIGGPEAEKVLLDVLKKTASGAEVAWLDEILDRLNPGTHRDKVLEAARAVLKLGRATDETSLLDRQSKRYLLAVLIRHRDLSVLTHFLANLVDAEGRLDPLAFRYLLDSQVTGGLDTLREVYRTRMTDADERRIVRSRLLRYVGTEPGMDTFYKETFQAAIAGRDGMTSRDVSTALLSLSFSPIPGQRLSNNPALIRNRLHIIDGLKRMISDPQLQKRIHSTERTLNRMLEPNP